MSNGGKRVAWVTGGGSGIGEAGANALATDGWTVVVSGCRKDALDAVVAAIGKSGGTAKAIPLDVSVAADVEKAAEEILAAYGRQQRPVVPSEQEQAKMLQPEDLGRTIAFVASLPPRVCVNEILISPTWNRGFIQTPANRD
jgi:NADP-dependent 3-hydroxy acid dehydrogenase YdfG